MKVRNIGPFSAGLTIAATGQDVGRGDTVDVDDELGLGLCEQLDNWAPVGEEATAAVVEHLRRRAAEQEADRDGLSVAEAKRAAQPFEPPPVLHNPVLAALHPSDDEVDKPKKPAGKKAAATAGEG